MSKGDVFVVGLMVGAAFGSAIMWYFTDLNRRKALDSAFRAKRDLETAERIRTAQVIARTTPLFKRPPGAKVMPEGFWPIPTESERAYYEALDAQALEDSSQ